MLGHEAISANSIWCNGSMSNGCCVTPTIIPFGPITVRLKTNTRHCILFLVNAWILTESHNKWRLSILSGVTHFLWHIRCIKTLAIRWCSKLKFSMFLNLWTFCKQTHKTGDFRLTDFYEFTAENSSRNTKIYPELPLLAPICAAQFKKGSRLLYYTTDCDKDNKELGLLKPKCCLQKLANVRSASRGTTTSK